MSCGCRSVAEVRAEDRSEVTSVSRKRGQGRTPRRGTGGWRVDFLSRITFSFFAATAVYCASNAATIWWHMWGAVLAVERATIS